MNWIKENWEKIVIGLLLVERFYYYLFVNPQIFSFFKYAESVFGEFLK